MGLRKVELAIKNVGLSELGQGVKAPSAAQLTIQKGKEKVGVVGNGLWPRQGFKPKKKVLFGKAKSGVGQGLG